MHHTDGRIIGHLFPIVGVLKYTLIIMNSNDVITYYFLI
jgi:hypothetical protein